MNVSSRDRFPYTVVRKCVPALGQSGVWNGCIVHHALVVAKKPRRSINRYTHHTKSVPEVNYLLYGLPCGNELRSESSSLHLCLALGERINWRLIQEMNDAGTATSGN